MSMRRSVRWGSSLAAVCGVVVFLLSCEPKKEAAQPASTSPPPPVYNERGQQAYLAHCAMCHGPWGEGDGTLAVELVKQAGTRPAQLNDVARLAELGRPQVVRIITLGGGKTHRSNLMPPWGSRIPAAVIGDIADFVMALPSLKPGVPRATIAKYLEAPPGTPAEGRRLFVYHCTMCHGAYGKGDGLVADTLWARNHIRPRNLTDSVYFAKKTDQELFTTVSLGGPYTGHSSVMPGWSVNFTPGQIKDVVSYVREISRTTSRP